MSDHKEHFETTCVHAGRGTDPTSGGVSPAIQLSTTFERGADGNYPHGHTYSRSRDRKSTRLNSSHH